MAKNHNEVKLYFLQLNASEYTLFFTYLFMKRVLRDVKSFIEQSMLMGGGPQVSVDKRVNGVSFTKIFENLLFPLKDRREKKKVKTFQKLSHT